MRAHFFGFLLLAGVSLPAAGQQKPTALPPMAHAPGYSWQASIAIHPKNPQNMVVAVSPGTVYYTVDGGNTWKTGTVPVVGEQGDARLISDGHGTFYYFQTNGPGITACYTSRDGQTWDTGTPVAMDNTKHNERVNVSADAKGSLYVTYTQFDEYPSEDAACRSSIWMTRSSNGKKWSTPKEMSQTAGRCNDARRAASGALAAVAADGKSYVAWLTGQTIFMDRSFDGSMWLSNDITVTRLKADAYSEPTLLVDRSKGPRMGSLYMAWSDTRSSQDDADVWFIRSTNYGDNWTSPQRVNDDALGQQYQPAMAIDPATGILYMLYFDRRATEGEGLATEVYLAWSNDGGNNFHNKKISTAPFTGQTILPERGYTGLAVHKGTIAAVWIQDLDGKPAVFTNTLTQEALGAAQIATK
ncbi:sialidase family protein [Dawidia soli]|uniref:Glycoside hydrolase n=1 Tax=Dawidia soli TaxID=2782352 RepID=A0AAP2D5J7_9BACT|nr:sialidase family protein [Dawidia soli]MBT1685713.1 glycoside hydrolase [Dawidia soli]